MFDFMSGFRDPDDPFGLKKLAAASAVSEIPRPVPTTRFGPDGQPIAANAPPVTPGPTLTEGAVSPPTSPPGMRGPEAAQPVVGQEDYRKAPAAFDPAPTAPRQPEILTASGDPRLQVSAVDKYQAEIQKALENKAWNEAIAGIAKMFPATPAPNRGPPQAPQIGRGIAPNPGDRLRGKAESQLASLIDQFKARSLISKTRPAAPGQNISFPRGRGSNLTDILRKLS